MGGNRKKAIFCCDFDGTITSEDLGVATMKRFAPPEWWDYELRWRQGEISSIECLQRQFGLVDASEDELREFYLAQPVDETFGAFAEACERAGIGILILSDGLDFYIDIILERMGLSHLPYRSNRFEIRDGRQHIEFPHRSDECAMCGNCKRAHVDVLYAKDALAEHCRKEGIAFRPFQCFADVELPD